MSVFWPEDEIALDEVQMLAEEIKDLEMSELSVQEIKLLAAAMEQALSTVPRLP